MSKMKSIFVKIGLLVLLILLVMESAVLVLNYNTLYDSNYADCEADIRNAAKMAVETCEAVNLYDPPEHADTDKVLSDICEMFNITYLFAVEPDIRTRSETYLAIGFGKDALQEAKANRHRGVRVEGMLNEQQIEAYNGNKEGIILHEVSTFDDTLVCYMPCTRYLDAANRKYITYEKPAVIGAEISLDSVNQTFVERFQKIALLTLSMTLLIAVAFALLLYFKISKPIRVISGRMSSFVSERENKKVEKLEIKGNDELALMARSFNTMTDEINRYIGDIDALTREKHTQEAELNIARRIQMGLLQPDRTEHEALGIRAYVRPAKDVGGDLYDYRILGDGRVFVAVADVSGKGISAALFMSRAVTLLHQLMLTQSSPREIMEMFNDTLCAKNPGGMFITAFIAVWEPETGKLTYTNAGHNLPYILSDTLITLDQGHGVAAGLFEGERYENACATLREGDTLFLYTDGVNEAKNADGGFYSTKRLEDQLTACIGSDKAELPSVILSDLNRFTEGAEQNDDITMLSLHIKERGGEKTLRLLSELKQLEVIRDAIRQLPVSEDLKKTLFLAAEEIFVNICSYAYDEPGEVEIRLRAGDGVKLTFSDRGKPFDPTAEILDIDEYDHENAIGGLGRFLTFSIADRYRYEYRDGKNTLYLYFSEVNQHDNHKEA